MTTLKKHPVFPSIGVELEMPTALVRTGETHPVGPFFRNLQQIRALRGEKGELLAYHGRDYGLKCAQGLHSIDNGFNNLESSLGPVRQEKDSLSQLHRLIRRELKDISAALDRENAMVINFSEHPDVRISPAFYTSVRAPRSIYNYQTEYRKWNHMAGFDAKAQNSPSTETDLGDAVTGLNCLLGLAPAFIALYANSPFEAGRITGFKENRLTLWSRQMNCSRMMGDRKLHMAPAKPFRNLADYLKWMFGAGTSMWFVSEADSLKNPADMYLIPCDPPLLDFLKSGPCQAKSFFHKTEKRITPGIRHLVDHQFTQYTDCRIRYGLNDKGPDLGKFMDIMDNYPDKLEEFLAPFIRFCYLEGRAAGANYPDRDLAGLDKSTIASSLVISPCAMQYGLLRNLSQTAMLMKQYRWTDLLGLRNEAVQNALDGEYNGIKVKDLCMHVVETAAQGLDSEHQWMLDYPLWVLQTGKTGADRALDRLSRMTGSVRERIAKLTLERRIVPI
ncbi:glutamate-cysteine ligase family protein [Desulfobotulus sp. H1]|uniref:Glutamate-cysteine ligase family protein n=1 Tax=Desulfobotulus pelophilus TaxID=2823377 RepID=A0ABT3N5G1_9BACT|nr:glutamate-cysteine ligase family protein [Desulfobotulus pelophilus]MCW7752684.1 glutamate-cysteine ligase family protein [Desulfobotulus pelophilus]